eukprot:CAMPEP_0185780738 /NCGR_PEP_ID=MMETSP1174-20130828/100068_1 /TAXON_ID=35687 /ORGANISM="Dictyocha speculum, Strain CCMP1381" /LENGTH=412 /DNA_ID=CAMNT_0028470417 /DNA_START=20 /DNA_END=1258 /DNA_ORIENTATION=-
MSSSRSSRFETKPEDTALGCLRMDDEPEIPAERLKWRATCYEEAGKAVIHPGLRDDFKDLDKTTSKFGKMKNESDHVGDVWSNPGTESAYAEAKHQQKETVYHSTALEPLGRSYVRGHALPDHMKNDNYSFGKSSVSSEVAKNLLYPRITQDDKKFKSQYVVSHGAYEPGEQKARDYGGEGWHGLDKDKHRFGVGVGSHVAFNGASLGVSSAMTMPETNATAPKNVEALKDLRDHVGRARSLGHGEVSNRPPVFGKSTLPIGNEAKECIEGDYSHEEQLPDHDLGTTNTPGFRNIATEKRAFGVPTVRTDIPKFSKVSISDSQNYGDDVTAQYLMYPQDHNLKGLGDDEFSGPLPKGELLSIFKSLSSFQGLSDAQLEASWRIADVDQSGHVSVKMMQAAVNEMLDAEAYAR